MEKWAGLASFVLAGALVVPLFIYLTGDHRSAVGALAYDLADFLYGPVVAVSQAVRLRLARTVARG